MKTLYIGILILIVLAGAGYIFTTVQDVEQQPTITTIPLTTISDAMTTLMMTTLPGMTTTPGITTVVTTVQTTIPTETQGILMMKIKDKLDLTNITAIDLTIDKVWVHKAGTDGDETESNETFETNDTSNGK